MSDIFAEVDADLRRDRWQALWDRYGLLVIGGAVGIVLLVTIIVGYRTFQQSQNEAASLRYEALLQQINEEEAGAKFEALSSFALEENNGYGVLAAFGAARAAAAPPRRAPRRRDVARRRRRGGPSARPRHAHARETRAF